MFFQVTLVILLSGPERHRCLNLGYHRLRPATGLIQSCDCLRCELFLIGRMKKDYRAILAANIRALPVQCGRVVHIKKQCQQGFITDLLWVKLT